MILDVGEFVGFVGGFVRGGFVRGGFVAAGVGGAVAADIVGAFVGGVGGAELYRSLRGWELPGNDENTALKADYYPGDIGFDPLGLKPDNFEDFSAMSTKELQNGRLAMLAVAGIVAQELVNGKEIFVNFGLAPDTFDPSTLPIKF